MEIVLCYKSDCIEVAGEQAQVRRTWAINQFYKLDSDIDVVVSVIRLMMLLSLMKAWLLF